jgi:O-antigen ligase
MAPYFPANSPIGNFHNSLVAVLVSFGVIGLLLVLALLLWLAVCSVRLMFRNLWDKSGLAERLVPAVLLFTVAESMMEQFLFTDGMPSMAWGWFLLSAGFLFCFDREARSRAKKEA